MTAENDFTKGSVWKNIMDLAVPMMLAQIINVLYSVVDRMYIGRIAGAGALALTGIGVAFPIITGISAFTNLFGMGGAPLCSIARGRGDHRLAEKIMGNSFTLLAGTGLLLTILGLVFKRPLLYAFGASDATYPYANAYITIYLLGSICVMIGLGMNSFINSQGFGRMGMFTVLIGAVLNLILDPIFIFGLGLGVYGAALATILSQLVSMVWVVRFLTGSKAILVLRLPNMQLEWELVKQITALGFAGFMMAVTNSAVQIVCNATLKRYGGDLYVGVMTVINSVREVLTMPVQGLTNGAQPVLGYNYGAGAYRRVKKGIVFMSVSCIAYTVLAWLLTMLVPELFIRIFNEDSALIQAGIPAMHLYFFGFFMMSLQFSGQSVFIALGKSKQAVFFSLLRKAMIVIPLTMYLPTIWNLGTDGVFLAEPVSNFIGGTACFVTMLVLLWPALRETEALH